MMGLLRRWLLGVILTSFAVGMAEQLVPKGRERALVRLVGGLMLTLALLRPMGDLVWEDRPISVGAWGENLQSQTAFHREQQQKELSSIIAEKLEAYIWDKAIEMGLDGNISVSIRVQPTGIPLPDTVSIGTPFDSTLAVWLEEVVGIPAEKQLWQEGSS